MQSIPPDEHHFAHTLPFGAELIAENRVRFRLWAPDLDSLSPEDSLTLENNLTLEIEGAAPQTMQRDGDGFFMAVCEARAGARYRYRINAELAVPDPAARLQSDDVHGWSVVIDPRAYAWQPFPWKECAWRGRPWHEIIIYELHVGCCGGFAGVEMQLETLAQLGITAIELMPIADFSGTRNWGYDGVLPFAPATAYGTPHQLKHLIERAHAHGLCVYLDVVYNHFGPDGNFLHTYASKFFSPNKSAWGEAIDFSQPVVREFFIHNALYWLLEYRFDGLRFDAVHAISDSSWLDEMAARVRAAIEPDRHVHLMLENERNSAAHLARDFNAQWNDDWHNALHVLLTGEREGYYAAYTDEPAQKLARSLAEGFIYQGEPSPLHDNQPRGEPSAFLPPTAFINFLQNHDQIGNRALGERLTVLADQRNLRAAITLQLLMPSIPLLFMGEPWLVRTPFLFFTDFHDALADAVRNGRAQEFSAFAAFQNAEQRARIPDPNAYSTFSDSIPHCSFAHDADAENRASDEIERTAAFTWYRELLQLRHRHIMPRLANCRALFATAIGDAAVIASWQFGDGAQLQIAVNFSAAMLSIAPPQLPLLYSSVDDAGIAQGFIAAHCTAVFFGASTNARA